MTIQFAVNNTFAYLSLLFPLQVFPGSTVFKFQIGVLSLLHRQFGYRAHEVGNMCYVKIIYITFFIAIKYIIT